VAFNILCKGFTALKAINLIIIIAKAAKKKPEKGICKLCKIPPKPDSLNAQSAVSLLIFLRLAFALEISRMCYFL
jgi:hypothetical protein